MTAVRAEPRSAALLREVLDPGTFRRWDGPAGVLPPAADTPGYRDARAAARRRSGTDESIVTGEGRIGGHRVAVVCSEFAFLAGSVGADAAERVVAAVERATAEGLPVLAAPASGGTRMQEGTPAFLRMVAIAGAVTAHRAAGLPYLVYLRHPTTGGVLASWASLGQVTFAESGALVGFLGPKVYAALHGQEFPRDVQTAENLHAHGLVDAVLTPPELAGTTARLLSLLARNAAPHPPPSARSQRREPTSSGAWQSVTSTRRADRPSAAELIRYAAADVVPLNGTGEGGIDSAVLLCLARFGPRPCVVVAQDRTAQERSPLGPDALRTARRGMRLASELGLPLVTVIDTPGAALSRAAEENGLAGQIARCLADLARLPVPTVSVLLGQGCGGAALALLPADGVIAARHAWLTPLPLEGASEILHGTTVHAPRLAEAQRIRAADLLRAGAVDRIVDELPDAADEPTAFLYRVGRAIETELMSEPAIPAADRPAARVRRWRAVAM